METIDTRTNDTLLTEACVRGEPAACEEFEREYGGFLRALLIKRGASYDEAGELARNLLSDCIMGRAGRPPLLNQYRGRCSLRSWLATCATNLLIDLKRAEKIREEASELKDERNHFDTVAPPVHARPEAPLLELLHRSLAEAMQAIAFEDRLMLRLAYLEGVTQRELARVWGCHESKVSRKLDEAMRTIAARTLDHVSRRDPWLTITWEDFLEMCQSGQTPLPV